LPLADLMMFRSSFPLWFLALSAAAIFSSPAQATRGNVLAKGIVYQAATYISHPRYGTHPSYYGNPPEQVVDINIGTNSDDDYGMPLFAPEDGTVTVIHRNSNAWGYSLEWRNRAGTERLFMAHLKCIVQVGSVLAGQKIAEIGGTGGWKPHLHIESSKGWLALSGCIVRPPVNPYGNGTLHVSNGPAPLQGFFAPPPIIAKQFFPQRNGTVMELGGGSGMRPFAGQH
jgi:murein DD-endopeptidase MepM/ murein hydrolase activator NlpD